MANRRRRLRAEAADDTHTTGRGGFGYPVAARSRIRMPRPPVTIECFGARWQLDLGVLDDDLAGVVEHLWERCRVADDPQAPVFRVRAQGEAAVEGEPGVTAYGDPDGFPYALSRALTRASIERRRGAALMLHAAGLTSADGQRALVLPAASGTGKSTAIRVLGPHFGYLSDETIAIEADGTIVPYPKPLSLVAGVPGGKEEISPDDAGLGPTSRGARVAAVVALERSLQTGPPELLPEDLISGILHLIGQSSSVPLLPEPLRQLAGVALTGGGPYVLRYAEIDECRDLLTALVDAPAPPREVTWAHLPPPGDRHTAQVPHWPSPLSEQAPEVAIDTVVDRAAWTDAIEVDTEVLVLVNSQPIRLAGIGASLWLEAVEPVSVASLVDHVVALHGPHRDAVDLVTAAVAELLRVGVLRTA